MTKVNDYYGEEISFEAACNIMDTEITEDMHGTFAEGQDQEYFDEYAKRHAAKYDGEEFAPYYGHAW